MDAIKTLIDQAEPVDESGQKDRWADRRVGSFYIKDGYMGFMRQGRDAKKNDDNGTALNEIETPLTDNFIALITEQQVLDDGAKQEMAFFIEGKQRGKGELPALTVPATQYPAMQWPVKHWGARAIIEADQATPRRLSVGILKLSGDIPIKTIYQHTGWRKIENQWHYLGGNGGIHAGGLNESITVQLDDGHMKNYTLPAPSKNPRQNARGFLHLLDLAPNNSLVGVALFAGVARAVLGGIHKIDFSLYFAGRSGSHKSECAALGLSFFGTFDARSFPANFSDTESDIEFKAHQAKDALFVVDDFAPSVNTQEANKLYAKAERIFRSVGNQSGRGRRNADMSGKAAYFPRGLVLATAEDLTKGASLLGRMLVVEMKRGDVDLSVLTMLQDFARTGRLAGAMADFIQWLAPRMAELKTEFPAKVRQQRDQKLATFAKSHPRAPEIYANLMESANVLLDYLYDIGEISETVLGDLAEKMDETLQTALISQSQYQREFDEVERFVSLLRACFASGDIHVSDHLNQGPPQIKPFIFGWRASSPGADLSGCGQPVGWINEPLKQLWLQPESTFKAIQKFATSQNDPFLMSKATLWKRLLERGLLLTCEDSKGMKRPAVKRKIEVEKPDEKINVAGGKARVLVFSTDLITDCDESSA